MNPAPKTQNTYTGSMVKRCRPLVLILVALAVPLAVNATNDVDLVILHMNDTHGTFSATPESIRRKRVIGDMPRFGALVRHIQRANKGRVLTLHAGDLFSKAAPVTVHSGGQVSMDILATLNVDALVPGNGEFYFGLSNLLERAHSSTVPVVLSNIKYRTTKKNIFPSHIIAERQGVRIGVVGIGFCRMNHYSATPLILENAIEGGVSMGKKLRGEVDLLIALTHIGHGNDLKLAAKAPQFDLIVGGHSHTCTKEPVLVPRANGNGSVRVVQAGEYWQFLGRVDVHMVKATEGFKVGAMTGKLLPVPESMERDKELAGILADFRQPLKKVLAENQPQRAKGEVMQIALKAIQERLAADVVVLDNGVIQDLPPAGSVALSDIYLLHPWRNHIRTASVTGAQLTELTPKMKTNSKLAMLGPDTFEPDSVYTMCFGDYTESVFKALSKLDPQPTKHRVDTILAARYRELGNE